jgi:hypothetical protein
MKLNTNSKIALVVVGVILVALFFFTQRENLEGDIGPSAVGPAVEEPTVVGPAPEKKVPVPAKVGSAGLFDVAKAVSTIKNAKTTDIVQIEMIRNLSKEIKVGDDPKTYEYCQAECDQTVFNDPKQKKKQGSCKKECGEFISQICNTGCSATPDDPVCKGACKPFIIKK